MIKKLVYKIFGTRNERLLKQYAKIVNQINFLEWAAAVMGFRIDDC